MMLAVAAAALVIAGARGLRAWAEAFRIRAEKFSWGKHANRGCDLIFITDAEELREWGERERETVRFLGTMQAKYERAALYPWLPVSPDPPEADIYFVEIPLATPDPPEP